jgi:hypothetical protein
MSMPVVCDLRYGSNEYVETYRGYQIWRCYAPPPIPGQPSIAVYYELAHPDESRSTNIEDVRNWIDANLAPPTGIWDWLKQNWMLVAAVAGAAVVAIGIAVALKRK